MSKYTLGVDLGQAQDYTALDVIESMPNPDGQDKKIMYALKHLERFKDTSYPDVVARVQEVIKKLGGADLVVDATGCGLPVIDMLRRTRLRPVAIQIHGGDHVSSESSFSYRVPKRDLVAALQVVSQTNRLKIPLKLRLSQLLQGELLNFKVKIDPATAHDSYSAWREGIHDDLVLATSLGIWYAETRPKPQRITFTDCCSPSEKAMCGGRLRPPGTSQPPSRFGGARPGYTPAPHGSINRRYF